MLAATLDSVGLSLMPDFLVADHLATDRLETVLDDWSQPFPGLHLFYPSRRHASAAFSLALDALWYRV